MELFFFKKSKCHLLNAIDRTRNIVNILSSPYFHATQHCRKEHGPEITSIALRFKKKKEYYIGQFLCTILSAP